MNAGIAGGYNYYLPRLVGASNLDVLASFKSILTNVWGIRAQYPYKNPDSYNALECGRYPALKPTISYRHGHIL